MEKKTRLIRTRVSKSQEAINRIAALEAKIAALEARLAQVETYTYPWNQPINPQPMPTWPIPNWPIPDNSDEARCHVCNNRYKDMTHYVCNHPECPSRITYCLAPQATTACPNSKAFSVEAQIDNPNPEITDKNQ